jgi:hypothetical protein
VTFTPPQLAEGETSSTTVSKRAPAGTTTEYDVWLGGELPRSPIQLAVMSSGSKLGE